MCVCVCVSSSLSSLIFTCYCNSPPLPLVSPLPRQQISAKVQSPHAASRNLAKLKALPPFILLFLCFLASPPPSPPVLPWSSPGPHPCAVHGECSNKNSSEAQGVLVIAPFVKTPIKFCKLKERAAAAVRSFQGWKLMEEVYLEMIPV